MVTAQLVALVHAQLPPEPPSQPPSLPSPVVTYNAREIAAGVILVVLVVLPIILLWCVCSGATARSKGDASTPPEHRRYQHTSSAPKSLLNRLVKRFIIKPFHRWSFAMGRRFTDESIADFTVKYLFKYLIKREKLNMERRSSRRLSKVELERVVHTAARALHLHGYSAAADERDDTLEEALARHHPELDPRLSSAVAEYAKGLHAACCTNIGLSHAKAREYWIYRGPRQLLTAVAGIVCVLILNEGIRTQSFIDRALGLSQGLLATLVAIFMLYYRLPDAIRSGVVRSAHDYYGKAKKKLNTEASELETTADQSEQAEQSGGALSVTTASELSGTDDEMEHVVRRRRPSKGFSPSQRRSSARDRTASASSIAVEVHEATARSREPDE